MHRRARPSSAHERGDEELGVYSSRDDDENLAAGSSGPRPRASREIRIRSRWRALEGDLRSGEETFIGRLPSSRRRPHPFVGLAARPTANHFMIEPGWRRPPPTPRLQPARSYQRVSVGSQTTPRHQCNLSSTDVPLMPRCSTSILLHSAGGALERPTARTRCTYSTYHTTLHYIPQDENTAAGRSRAGGWRPGTRRPAIGGGTLVNTEKQKTKPKANKLSKRDALQTDKPSYQSFQ